MIVLNSEIKPSTWLCAFLRVLTFSNKNLTENRCGAEVRRWLFYFIHNIL